jgi:lysophospholipase L1-like esterase
MKGESKPKKPFVTTEETERWFSIAAIDVATDGAAMPCVAVLGNSITDGRGTTTNAQNRWTDIFAEALQGRVAVLNLGIGGNCVISGGISQPAMQRFDRDILAQSGLSAVVIFEGINDIGNSSQSEETVRQLIAAYQELIGKCRRQGLKVFGATITPLGDSDYRSFFHEAARQTVNQWIRTCGLYDAVIDFDQLVRDPAQPDKIPAKWLFDPLHPNADCYRVMGLHAAEVLRPLLEAR